MSKKLIGLISTILCIACICPIIPIKTIYASTLAVNNYNWTGSDSAKEELSAELTKLMIKKDTGVSTGHFTVTKPKSTDSDKKYKYVCKITVDTKKYSVLTLDQAKTLHKEIFNEAKKGLDNENNYPANLKDIPKDYLYDSILWRNGDGPAGKNRVVISGNTIIMTFELSYRTTIAEDNQMFTAARNIANKLTGTQYEKIKQLYDYFLKNGYKFCPSHYASDGSCAHIATDYRSKCYSPYSVLCGTSHEGVCQAFAQSFQLVCHFAGIKCWYLLGSLKQPNGSYLSHGFNAVMLDGKYYFLDITYELTHPREREYRYFLKGHTKGSSDGRAQIFENHYTKVEDGVVSSIIRLNKIDASNKYGYNTARASYADYLETHDVVNAVVDPQLIPEYSTCVVTWWNTKDVRADDMVEVYYSYEKTTGYTYVSSYNVYDNYLRVEHLTPGKTVYIKLVPCRYSSTGKKITGKEKILETKLLLPCPIASPSVTKLSSTSAKISWTVPLDKDGHEQNTNPCIGYEIFLCDKDGKVIKSIAKTSAKEQKITNLTPGQTYYYKIAPYFQYKDYYKDPTSTTWFYAYGSYSSLITVKM